MVVETLVFMYLCWSSFDLAPIDDVKDKPLHTFSSLILLYFAVFSVVSVRERRWFWATMPSISLLAALAAEALAGTVLALVGLPGLAPLPWQQMLAIFGYAMVSCLVLNDALKVLLIKRLVPMAVA
jgi:H+-transporting ATPase